jgi:hypothetical protein
MSDTSAISKPGPDTPFELGLVMAGAISAGAYTAGVIDFLIEALDEWQIAKQFARQHPDESQARDCPMHEVKLRVMAGASAGGMTAALATGLLGMNYQSVTEQPRPDHPVEPLNNNLYKSWVNLSDIEPLLGARDLAGGRDVPVESVLDSSILRDIAESAFRFEKPDERAQRQYVADPLHVLVTVTNLRGVPYAPSFENWPRTLHYEMMMHADYMHFVLSRDEPRDREAVWLKPYDFADAETWGTLQAAALASGAFPIGLAPQLLKRAPSQYRFRKWPMPGPHEENGRHYCEYWRTLAPNWPTIDQAEQASARAGTHFSYEFLCVDGGVMNNEPLDLARRILSGPNSDDSSAGDQSTRAVLMVMPFPNAAPFPTSYDGRTSLCSLLSATFSALISQARFKPQELAMANDPDVYSRFLIVPRRGCRANGSLEPFTIACGSLGGFGGFISRRFREHDYQLGRRNCQWFLKQHFALPCEGEHRNKLFDRWSPEAREKHRIVQSGQDGAANANRVLLPIIPLLGKAASEIPEPTWPTFTEAELAVLSPKVQNRIGRVLSALIDEKVQGWFWGPLTRGALKSSWWFQKNRARDSITKMIRDDLTTRGLMARR